MLLLMSLLILPFGVLALVFPEAYYELTEHWKSYALSEPSKLYKVLCRIGGGVMTLTGLAGVVLFFVTR